MNLVRDREDFAQEVGISQVFAESLIRGRRLLPGIPPADQVDEDDTE